MISANYANKRFASNGPFYYSEESKSVSTSNPFMSTTGLILPPSIDSIKEDSLSKRKIIALFEENPLSKKAYQVNLTYLNGMVYKGKLIDGQPYGEGIFTSRDGIEIFEGKFIAGQTLNKARISDLHGESIYSGEIKITKGRAVYHGEGEVFVWDQFHFRGQFKDGLRHGRFLIFNEILNKTFECTFVNNELDQKAKVTIFPLRARDEKIINEEKRIYEISEADGYQYKGQIKIIDGKKIYHGLGMLIYPDKSIYAGQFKDGLRHGNGQIQYYSHSLRFTGTFVEDSLETGKVEYLGEEWTCEGDLTFKEFWDSSYVFEKEVLGENLHLTVFCSGNGKIRSENGIYEGEILNSDPHGNGRMVYVNGDIYEGECKRVGKEIEASGRGKMVYVNGDIYEGEFIYGKRQGIGLYTGINGESYNGEFKAGYRHGYGETTFADGKIYRGQHDLGKCEGQGTLIFKNGIEHTGYFQDGQMIYPIILQR